MSRRATKSEPSHAFRSARSSASDRTAGDASGTDGERIRSIGFDVVSPSSSAHLKNCCRDRNRTPTVLGLNRPSKSSMNASTCSRAIEETAVGIPRRFRKTASFSAASVYD